MNSYQCHGRWLRDIPVELSPILRPSSGRPPQATPPSFLSDLGVQDRPVTKNDTYQQRSLDPGKTGRALYCGGGMLSVFAVDRDDCRSGNVTRANGSPDIGCSPSGSTDASDGTLKAVATTAGEL